VFFEPLFFGGRSFLQSLISFPLTFTPLFYCKVCVGLLWVLSFGWWFVLSSPGSLKIDCLGCVSKVPFQIRRFLHTGGKVLSFFSFFFLLLFLLVLLCCSVHARGWVVLFPLVSLFCVGLFVQSCFWWLQIGPWFETLKGCLVVKALDS